MRVHAKRLNYEWCLAHIHDRAAVWGDGPRSHALLCRHLGLDDADDGHEDRAAHAAPTDIGKDTLKIHSSAASRGGSHDRLKELTADYPERLRRNRTKRRRREGLQPGVKWSETPGNALKTDPTPAKGWRKMHRANEKLSRPLSSLVRGFVFVRSPTRSSAPGSRSRKPSELVPAHPFGGLGSLVCQQRIRATRRRKIFAESDDFYR